MFYINIFHVLHMIAWTQAKIPHVNCLKGLIAIEHCLLRFLTLFTEIWASSTVHGQHKSTTPKVFTRENRNHEYLGDSGVPFCCFFSNFKAVLMGFFSKLQFKSRFWDEKGTWKHQKSNFFVMMDVESRLQYETTCKISEGFDHQIMSNYCLEGTKRTFVKPKTS